MKAKSTVDKALRELRKSIDEDSDNLTKRIAWEVEHAIRWAREDVKGWPRPLESVRDSASLIRREIQSGEIAL